MCVCVCPQDWGLDPASIPTNNEESFPTSIDETISSIIHLISPNFLSELNRYPFVIYLYYKFTLLLKPYMNLLFYPSSIHPSIISIHQLICPLYKMIHLLYRVRISHLIMYMIRRSLGAQSYWTGSFAFKTYLPDEDISMSTFLCHGQEPHWFMRLLEMLCKVSV